MRDMNEVEVCTALYLKLRTELSKHDTAYQTESKLAFIAPMSSQANVVV